MDDEKLYNYLLLRKTTKILKQQITAEQGEGG